MRNNNLNLLIKASVTSKKLLTLFYCMFILICTSLITISASAIMPLGSNIDNKINNHITKRELVYTSSINNDEKDIQNVIRKIKNTKHVCDVYKIISPIEVSETSGILFDTYKLTSLHKQSNPLIIKGRRFNENERGVALVSQKIKDFNEEKHKIFEINGEKLIGKTLSLSSENGCTCKFKVVGAFSTSDPLFSSNEIIIPRKELKACSDKLKRLETDNPEELGRESYIILVDSTSNVIDVMNSIALPENISRYDLGIDSDLYNICFYVLIGALCFFVLLTIAGFYFFLKSNVNNRINELALYRSVGYKTKHIFYIVFCEYFLSGLISIAFGVILSELLCVNIVNPYISKIVEGTIMEMEVNVNFFEIVVIMLFFFFVLMITCKKAVRKTEKIDLTILLNEK